ncbi:MAG: SDR family oxidoreductase [Planctomycetes bacterium]|nr:SDR family oxidoreductase [Planctomycetota bacterium]
MSFTTVITGGAGFLGSHLCDYFIGKGHNVICIDNLITGNIRNIEHLFGSKNFRFIKFDTTEYIFIDGKVDFILHFASPASPKDYLELPIQTLKVGALGTHKALGLAKAKKAVFLIASSSEVYGDPAVHPQEESYWGHVNPVGPRGVYDESKRFGEALTMAYHRYHKMDTKIVRLFNTYGPRMRINDGRALPTFIPQALANKNITIFGDGRQTRSFCYVSDTVEGIYRLLMSKAHDPVNIGNPCEISVEGVAKEVIKLAKSKSKIKYLPAMIDDPKVRQPNIDKARKLLGWEPKIGREQGLKKTIEYFAEELKIKN